jgi:hypothetical protein
MRVYRFYVDCGRMGALKGTFVATEDQVQQAIGKEARFGEVLGKHSDITVTLTEKMFGVVTDDLDFVGKFSLYRCESGFNPLHYIESQEG